MCCKKNALHLFSIYFWCDVCIAFVFIIRLFIYPVNSVAISGIVDLDVHKDVPQYADLLSECRVAVELQYPKIRDHLQTYRQFVDDDDGLKEARLDELMKQLKEDMPRFKDDSDEMIIIEILRIL
jgi:hypothetical protein